MKPTPLKRAALLCLLLGCASPPAPGPVAPPADTVELRECAVLISARDLLLRLDAGHVPPIPEECR